MEASWPTLEARGAAKGQRMLQITAHCRRCPLLPLLPLLPTHHHPWSWCQALLHPAEPRTTAKQLKFDGR